MPTIPSVTSRHTTAMVKSTCAMHSEMTAKAIPDTRTNDEAKHRRNKHDDDFGNQQNKQEVAGRVLGEVARSVSSQAKCRGVAEGDEPRVADEKVETYGPNGENHRLGEQSDR
jgi:hypothetical protein